MVVVAAPVPLSSKDLHGDDLSVGGHAGEGDGALAVHGVTGGDAGHMGAVLRFAASHLLPGAT